MVLGMRGTMVKTLHGCRITQMSDEQISFKYCLLYRNTKISIVSPVEGNFLCRI